jgi:hypothetical protein
MKIILMFGLLVSMSGCAHTLYERCSKDDEFKRYGGMDQCMAEKSEKDARISAAAAAGWNRGYNSGSIQPQPVPTRQKVDVYVH